MTASILAAAIAIDAIVGDPPWLWRRLPHPVVIIGRGIGWVDARFNREVDDDVTRRTNGVALVAACVAASILTGLALQQVLAPLGPAGFMIEAVVVATLLAQRSLHEHVAAVRDGLLVGLPEGRRAVAMIVGRDPERLDRSGVARAAIESAAENLADGIVAPAFWYLIGGLPGIIAYKAINTADSMIGHRSERHRAFGWAAARLDDFANWLPARLAALMIALARPSRAWQALEAARRDAPRHRSPNAGWPEAAMAGALNLAVGGPRSYGDGELNEPVINPEGRRDATEADIDRALRLLRDACLVQAGLIVCLAML